jgi:hypothetical protein
MCSNCSGDDLRPESFATFDVSSPEGVRGFAGHTSTERKRYGTSRMLAMLRNTALSQAICRLWRCGANSEIIKKIDPGGFVNLNSAAAAHETSRKINVPVQNRELVEIRVSADAIIEVFAAAEAGERSRDECRLDDARYLSAWEESFTERSELRRTLNGFRRARRVKYFAAYGMLVTCAALAIWYAFS